LSKEELYQNPLANINDEEDEDIPKAVRCRSSCRLLGFKQSNSEESLANRSPQSMKNNNQILLSPNEQRPKRMSKFAPQ